MELQLFFTFAVIVGAYCQISNDIDVDDIKKQLGENIPDFSLNGFDESQIPEADELDVIFRDKCDKKGGNGTYDNVKASKDVYLECVSSFVNVTELKAEVEEAKKTGSMDEVFGKYCDKYPHIIECTRTLLKAIDPCLEDHERKSLNTSIGLSEKLKDFVCFKNGDRIAMFVAEGGVECIKSQKEALQECVNMTIGSRMPTNMSMTPNAFPTLMFEPQDCKLYSKFRHCVIDALGHCPETTPGNLVDAVFKYFKKVLPCSPEDFETGQLKNSAFSFNAMSLVLLLPIILVKLMLRT